MPAPVSQRIADLRARLAGRPLLADRAVVAAAAVLAFLPWVAGLGFYSDDWEFLAACRNAPDQSVAGCYRAMLHPVEALRPLKLGYQAALYGLFGTSPLGYHLVNQAVLLGALLLLHRALGPILRDRGAALALTLAYGLAPHWATGRFWWAAFQTGAALLFFALGLNADVAAVRSRGPRAWALRLGSLACVLCVAMLYEVFLPLYVLAPLWLRRARADASGASRGVLASTAVAWAGVAAAVAFKLANPIRLPYRGAPDEYLPWLRDNLSAILSWSGPPRAMGLRAKEALLVHFADLGARLPALAWEALRLYATPGLVASASAIAALVALGVRAAGAPALRRREWALLAGAGAAAFVLGYAVFLTNEEIQVAALGPGNRTAVAAALGTALLFTSLFGLLAGALPAAWSRRTFAALLALWCGCGAILVSTAGTFWGEAWRRQTAVLDALQQRFPSLPPRSTLLLDGTCRYAGPAYVFEATWDLSGALATRYRDPTLRGEIVSPRMRVEDDAAVTDLYGLVERFPFGATMLFDARTGAARPVPDAAALREHLRARGEDACPPGRIGHGADVLSGLHD